MTDVAPIVGFVMAGANLAIWLIVLIWSARDWRRFHDERAARGVLLGMVLVASAIGGLVSVTGYYVTGTTGHSSEALAVLAAVARGATIIGGIAYLAAVYEGEGRE